jgi:hypothetical protein
MAVKVITIVKTVCDNHAKDDEVEAEPVKFSALGIKFERDLCPACQKALLETLRQAMPDAKPSKRSEHAGRHSDSERRGLRKWLAKQGVFEDRVPQGRLPDRFWRAYMADDPGLLHPEDRPATAEVHYNQPAELTAAASF